MCTMKQEFQKIMPSFTSQNSFFFFSPSNDDLHWTDFRTNEQCEEKKAAVECTILQEIDYK